MRRYIICRHKIYSTIETQYKYILYCEDIKKFKCLYIYMKKGDMMEIRKVQVTGGASYIISLPKEWAKSMGIKKNDSLGIITQPDGTLLITPRITGKSEEKVKEINVDVISDSTYLYRLLIGAYIAGYTMIRIKSDKTIPFFAGAVVRKFTQIAIGQEIVEESENYITIKDLLDPVEMPFIKTIKRMYVIVKSMHRDAISALNNGDKELIRDDIMMRDDDVDRLHWLIMRQQNMVLRNVFIAKKMNISAETAVTYSLVSKIIERIGDHAVRIANNIPNEKVNRKILDTIMFASNLVLNILDRSMDSFFKRNIKEANDNIKSLQKLEELCDKINHLALKESSELSISLGYITDSIRRTGEYCADLSEYVINLLI